MGKRTLAKAVSTKPKDKSILDIEDLYKQVFSPDVAFPQIRSKLISWYDRNRRILPWRGDPPPYRDDAKVALTRLSTEEKPRVKVSAYGTWVSEIMLQQTRVETVIDYYNRWMKQFPTVKDLAEADPEAVNAAWAGLGYYSRARNLQKGAKKVMEDYGGVVPGTVKELLTLPGVGEYTAGAIASISFNQPVPLVDGNVVRVFSRLGKVAREAKDRSMNKACWQFAEKLVDRQRPGDFNQALMELGAVVCTPKNPSCKVCPLQGHCVVQKLAPTEVIKYPTKAPKKVIPEKRYNVSVVTRTGENGAVEYLTIRRPETGLLAGQYEFLSLEIDLKQGKKRNREGCLKSKIDAVLEESGVCLSCVGSKEERQDLGGFKHTFSHVRYICEVETFHLASSSLSCTSCNLSSNAQWQTEEQLKTKGKTKLLTKCTDLVTKGRESDKPVLDKGQTLLTKHFHNNKSSLKSRSKR